MDMQCSMMEDSSIHFIIEKPLSPSQEDQKPGHWFENQELVIQFENQEPGQPFEDQYYEI